MTVLYFFNESPLSDNRNPLEDLSGYTRKDPAEIQQILWDLKDKGVITIIDGKISEFSKERAWNFLNDQVFFPERRSERRNIGIHV